MKKSKSPMGSLPVACYTLCLIVCSFQTLYAQKSITTISTSSSVNTTVSYTGYKSAGLRNPSDKLISYWDSTGTSFDVNFNASAPYNKLSLTQFSVSGISSTVIPMPVSSMVKVRRASNADVGDNRRYYNFWAAYTSIPAKGATSGTFNFSAPEVLNPEDAFITNNLTSGYDNIFQNTIASPHFGNIERVDFLIPSGLTPIHDTDRIESGAIVIDRGNGDGFKIAAILSVNSANEPTAYGPLISVSKSDFGGDLLSTKIDYGILINDVNYYSESRPSTFSSQNLRGVFISISDMGIALDQTFYGYSLFGEDVSSANPDWTTYPANTNSGSQLDPVNVMGLYKSAKSLLAVPVEFSASKRNTFSHLEFTLYNKIMCDKIKIERSADGIHYNEIGSVAPEQAGMYSFEDTKPEDGTNLYRLNFINQKASVGFSLIRVVHFPLQEMFTVYPVPSNDILNIGIPESWKNKNIKAELWTANGRLQQQVLFGRNDTRPAIRVSNCQPGHYQLRLINIENEEMLSKMIVIIR